MHDNSPAPVRDLSGETYGGLTGKLHEPDPDAFFGSSSSPAFGPLPSGRASVDGDDAGPLLDWSAWLMLSVSLCQADRRKPSFLCEPSDDASDGGDEEEEALQEKLASRLIASSSAP